MYIWIKKNIPVPIKSINAGLKEGYAKAKPKAEALWAGIKERHAKREVIREKNALKYALKLNKIGSNANKKR